MLDHVYILCCNTKKNMFDFSMQLIVSLIKWEKKYLSTIKTQKLCTYWKIKNFNIGRLLKGHKLGVLTLKRKTV